MSIITELIANDVRFPTSLNGDGSDAMHFDPDYSCVYVRIKLDSGNLVGHGHTFTIGRGTEVVLQAVLALKPLVVGKNLNTILENMASFWRTLTSDSQLRWIGPEKGVIHLATAAVVNAIWDLWAKIEQKPLWKLLVDMEPEKLVSVIDFRYITDALTPKEALDILHKNRTHIKRREQQLKTEGISAYTTGVGWTGYNEEKRRQLCRDALKQGYTRFKAKVGTGIEEDRNRLRIIREEIENDCLLMVDANQKWDVVEAINTMKQLTDFNLLWIEEPTSPDDVLGHVRIAQELSPYGIGVATGEQCQNRVLFKQFLAGGGMNYCQIDACRLGGVNEVLAVILMAYKYRVVVCPHAGGVGLCEYVQHLAMWDFVALTGDEHDQSRDQHRMVEYVPHLSEHFHKPAICIKGKYQPPTEPGYSGEMRQQSIDTYEYPNGSYWRNRLQQQKQSF